MSPFRSRSQQRMMFARGKKSKKFKKMAEEFADKTDFKSLPEKVKSDSSKGFRKSIQKRHK